MVLSMRLEQNYRENGVDHELLIDLPFTRGNYVHYDFLKLRYIRNRMTHVGHLAVGALPCDSNVNYYCSNIKLFMIYIYPHADCLKNTSLNAANGQHALKL